MSNGKEQTSRVKSASRAGIVALALVCCGVALMGLPLLLRDFAWNKYFVAFGLVSLLLGLSISFNALCDRFGRSNR